MFTWLRRAVGSGEASAPSPPQDAGLSPPAGESIASGGDRTHAHSDAAGVGSAGAGAGVDASAGAEGAAGAGGRPDGPLRHNVLFAGLRRSGKTSILKRVYENLESNETLYLNSDTTSRNQWTVKPVDGFVPLRLWDGPDPYTTPPRPMRDAFQGHGYNAHGAGTSGGVEFDEPPQGVAAVWESQQLRWEDVGAVVCVIDSLDVYTQALLRCTEVILTSFAFNPNIKYHIFVHKLDQGPGRETSFGMEDKREAVRSMEGNIRQELADASDAFQFAPSGAAMWATRQAAEKARAAQAGQRDRTDVSPLASSSTSTGLGIDGGAGGDYFGSSTGANRGGTVGSDFLDPHRARAPVHALEPQSLGQSSWSGSDSERIIPLEQAVDIEFHGTSIYDSSVLLAVSKVQQSLMEPYLLHGLESAVAGISSNCRFDGAFLVDVASKLYLASNLPAPTETPYEMINEYLSFIMGLSSIYADLQDPDIQSQIKMENLDSVDAAPVRRPRRTPRVGSGRNTGHRPGASGVATFRSRPRSPEGGDSLASSRRSPSSPTMPLTFGGQSSTYLTVNTPRPRALSGNKASSMPSQSHDDTPRSVSSRSKKSTPHGSGGTSVHRGAESKQHSAAAVASAAVVHDPGVGTGSGFAGAGAGEAAAQPMAINTGQPARGKYTYSTMWMVGEMGLAFYQIDNHFALVAIIRKDSQEQSAGLIQYNMSWFRRTISELITVIQTQQLRLERS